MFIFEENLGPDDPIGKALGYGPDGQDTIPGSGGMEMFLYAFVSRIGLRSTWRPVK